jgi:hypothetical protein
MYPRVNIRKYVFWVIGGIITIFLLAWLWRYYHTGTIIITTNDPDNAITLTKINSDGSKDNSKKFTGREKLSVTVATGSYEAYVKGSSIATFQIIKLGPRKTVHYNINPVNATGVEPVVYQDAEGITATSRQLIFLDNSSGTLYNIDGQNKLSKVDAQQHYQTVKWSDPSFGVVQDNNSRLYSVINGKVSALNVPFNYDDSYVNYDVSPDKKIYISHSTEVYRGDYRGDFKKIYTSDSDKPNLAATRGSVAVSSSRFGSNASNVSSPVLAIIGADGSIKDGGEEAERLSWSPNGQYLATVNETNPTIYDNSLKRVAVVPTSSIVGQLGWLDKDTLLYSLNDELWTYNVAGQKSQLLSNAPLSNSITGLYVSSDHAYIYITTFDSFTSDRAIRRIGLRGQRVPDYIYQLQAIMPLQLNSRYLGLINFYGPPNVLVSVYPPENTQSAISSAKRILQDRGFDVSVFRFSPFPVGD